MARPRESERIAVAYPNRLTLAAPSGDGDIFVFFHDMLTMIAARLGENQPDKK